MQNTQNNFRLQMFDHLTFNIETDNEHADEKYSMGVKLLSFGEGGIHYFFSINPFIVRIE